MYEIDLDKLKTKFNYSEGKGMELRTGFYMPLFPYTTHEADYNIEEIIGTVLCLLDGKKPLGTGFDSMFSQMCKDIMLIDKNQNLKEDFKKALYNLYFDNEKNNYRQLNFRFIEQSYKEKNKVAVFLADVLADKEHLREFIDLSIENGGSNVLESFVLSKLDMVPLNEQPRRHYKRVVEFLTPLFNKDFAFVISSPERIRDYMGLLFDFYYFMYVSQSYMQLSRFTEGERYSVRPLYFCLEWEKTSSVRDCCEKGWKSLSNITKYLFSHAATLEALNVMGEIEGDAYCYDYIDLKEMTSDSEVADREISGKIIAVADELKKAAQLTLDDINLKHSEQGLTADAVKYLFSVINAIIYRSTRKRAAKGYGDNFKDVYSGFIKYRGRLGNILNISEEMLIFLTKLAINNDKKMRLNDVFKEFEKRGVFFDDASKDCISSYYEKLNLVDKKSDSGDSKYVRRII